MIQFDLTGNSKSYCCSTLIKCDKVKFGVLNTVNNSNFLSLKTHRANKILVLPLSDIAFKALLLGQSTNNIFRKDFSHAGRELQQVEAFPAGTVGGRCFCSSHTG